MSIQTCFKKAIIQQKNKPLRFYENFNDAYFIPAIFGYNYLPFSISKSKFIRAFFLIYSLTLSLGSSLVALSYVKHIHLSPYIFVAMEYIAKVSLLHIKNKCDIWIKFFKNVEVIDDLLGVRVIYYRKLKIVTRISIALALFTRILYSTSLCFCFKTYCNESPFLLFISGFILVAIDTDLMPRLIVFHIIQYRMNLLRERVEELFKIETVSVISSRNKRNSIVMYQNVYERILDSVHEMNKLLNPLFLLSLLCSFPKIMFLLYNIIVLHKKGVPLISLLALALEGLQWGLTTCLPGFVFEATRAHTDSIKLVLLKQYKRCNDGVLRPEIKEFLDYTEQRPCRFTVYRLIPVDVLLPVGLLRLCTTYLIVMIQFSHLFADINLNEQ